MCTANGNFNDIFFPILFVLAEKDTLQCQTLYMYILFAILESRKVASYPNLFFIKIEQHSVLNGFNHEDSAIKCYTCVFTI